MHSIPARKVKRRGVAALTGRATGEPGPPRHKSAWDFLKYAPSTGKRTRKKIDAQIREERKSWGKR